MREFTDFLCKLNGVCLWKPLNFRPCDGLPFTPLHTRTSHLNNGPFYLHAKRSSVKIKATLCTQLFWRPAYLSYSRIVRTESVACRAQWEPLLAAQLHVQNKPAVPSMVHRPRNQQERIQDTILRYSRPYFAVFTSSTMFDHFFFSSKIFFKKQLKLLFSLALHSLESLCFFFIVKMKLCRTRTILIYRGFFLNALGWLVAKVNQ